MSWMLHQFKVKDDYEAEEVFSFSSIKEECQLRISEGDWNVFVKQ